MEAVPYVAPLEHTVRDLQAVLNRLTIRRDFYTQTEQPAKARQTAIAITDLEKVIAWLSYMEV